MAVIILGRYPEWLYNFNSGVVRFGVRVCAWVYLQTDAWPPFGLSDDPSYPIRVNFPPPAASQSRLKAFFRIILALPMLIVSYAVNYVHLWIAVICLADDRLPRLPARGRQHALTFFNGFYARVYGYIALLTDDYPPIGHRGSKRRDGSPAGPPPRRAPDAARGADGLRR